MPKNILILTDFVGYGNVAMATSRSVLSKMGYAVYCLPTALISNTWNLGSVAQLDTTDYLKASLDHWERLGLRIDGVLLGYIGDEKQAAFLSQQCLRWQKKGIKIFFDPIFADNGKRYRGITGERLEFLRHFLPQADYALPNLTEAQFLTGVQEPMDALREIRKMGTGCAIITGVPQGDKNAVFLADREKERVFPYIPVPGSFPGAGDAFTAVFVGKVLSGATLEESVRASIDITKKWIGESVQEDWQGMGLPVEHYF